MINILLWRIHELDPCQVPAAGLLDRKATKQELRTWLLTVLGIVALLALDGLGYIIALTARVNVLEQRISELVAVRTPSLLIPPDWGILTAAKLFGETAASPGLPMRRGPPGTAVSRPSLCGRAEPNAGCG